MKHWIKYLKYWALAALGACALSACSKSTETPATSMETAPSSIPTKTAAPQQTEATDNSDIPSKATSAPALAATQTPTIEPTSTPIPDEPRYFAARHGALQVEGADLLDASGEKIQLYGMSTHGIGWFPQFVNYDSFLTLRDDWNTNCIRLAMYTAEDAGYCTGADKDALKALVKSGVDYATQLGMYVIIDWHVLQDQDPNVYKEEAKAFFEEMASTYAEHTNVLYEICNEPNGYATWDSVKAYAQEIIPIIRKFDRDAVIIVGTTTWSQDIDKALASPLEYDNLLYAMHFYAGTHKDDLRERLDSCVKKGLPVIISEFGMCDASGNGGNDFESSEKWMKLIEEHNLSFFCWNLANKDESSSVFKSAATKVSNWTKEDMNESGQWIREYFRSKIK